MQKWVRILVGVWAVLFLYNYTTSVFCQNEFTVLCQCSFSVYESVFSWFYSLEYFVPKLAGEMLIQWYQCCVWERFPWRRYGENAVYRQCFIFLELRLFLFIRRWRCSSWEFPPQKKRKVLGVTPGQQPGKLSLPQPLQQPLLLPLPAQLHSSRSVGAAVLCPLKIPNVPNKPEIVNCSSREPECICSLHCVFVISHLLTNIPEGTNLVSTKWAEDRDHLIYLFYLEIHNIAKPPKV